MSDTTPSPPLPPEPVSTGIADTATEPGPPVKPALEADDVLLIPGKPADAAADYQKVGFVQLTAQLFLIPLVIVAVCVGVFVMFGWMAADRRTGMELLARIEDYAGADNRMTPWMTASKNEAALQLMLLIRGDDRRLYEGARGNPRSPGGADDREAFENALIACFGRLQRRDPDAAGILARAIAHFGSAAGRAALRPAVHSDNRQLRFECIWALATLRDLDSLALFTEILGDGDPGCRKLGAWALGHLADPQAPAAGRAPGGRLLDAGQVREAVEKVRATLSDPDEEVRWNAAAALACLGSDAGVNVLLEVLDKAHVEKIAARAKAEADHPLHRKGDRARTFAAINMAAALQALGRLADAGGLGDPGLRGKVTARVRAAADDGTLDPLVQQEAGKLMRKL
jgi:hypothetical protein